MRAPERRATAPAAARLPITAGRVHFLRLVNASGEIRLLNESWRVGKRWPHCYVWATIITHEVRPAGPGTGTHIPARPLHSLLAKMSVVMLLLLLQSQAKS